MKRFARNSTIAILTVLAVACASVPFTGRKQAKLLGDAEMNTMSFQAYEDFLSKNPPLQNTETDRMVREIGVNIQKAAERYYQVNGLSDKLDGFAWEFNVVDDPTVNAWCMPGGKVVVYTGILPIAQNTDGLAVVMGHEIAHALAHHGNERMSQGLAVQLGGMALSEALSSKPQATQELFLQAYGVGAQVGAVLPFSRLHESEADEIGLYLAAMAGYDPTEAAPFWDRMNSGAGGAPPEFLSTHPSPDRRSENLEALVPKAREYAQKYGTGEKQPRKNF